MPYYLYKIQTVRIEMLTVGPTAMETETTTAHYNYLKALCDAGTIMLAGRTTNDDATTLGLNIFRAANDTAARDIVV
ncbi:MAG: hypothetical protein D6737_08385, partial [Chloroflexi bacterium]